MIRIRKLRTRTQLGLYDSPPLYGVTSSKLDCQDTEPQAFCCSVLHSAPSPPTFRSPFLNDRLIDESTGGRSELHMGELAARWAGAKPWARPSPILAIPLSVFDLTVPCPGPPTHDCRVGYRRKQRSRYDTANTPTVIAASQGQHSFIARRGDLDNDSSLFRKPHWIVPSFTHEAAIIVISQQT